MELCQGLLVVLLQYVLQKVDILIVLYAETDRVCLPSLKMFGFQLNFNQIFVIEQPIIFFKYYISILGRGEGGGVGCTLGLGDGTGVT